MTYYENESTDKSRRIGNLVNSLHARDAKIEKLEKTIAILRKRLAERTTQ